MVDPIQMKIGRITRAQAKRFKDNLAGFIQRTINSQEGLSILEDTRPVLCIRVVEANSDLGTCFHANLDSEQQGMVPTLYEINEYH